jgi:hypothetical protein
MFHAYGFDSKPNTMCVCMCVEVLPLALMHLIVIQIPNITFSKPLKWITSRLNCFWYEYYRLLLRGGAGARLTIETLRPGLGGSADT